MATRAVDLCVALPHGQPSIESVSRVLRDHGETGDLDLGEADVAPATPSQWRTRSRAGNASRSGAWLAQVELVRIAKRAP
ncbi:hypothetical protein [Nonomuraea sp. NPDC049784]|uniref:hypothetical protein n=1 Tax=Nonomuraea sp. NPDC049784 TaxID=3154361 RepID=UPI003410F05D